MRACMQQMEMKHVKFGPSCDFADRVCLAVPRAHHRQEVPLSSQLVILFSAHLLSSSSTALPLRFCVVTWRRRFVRLSFTKTQRAQADEPTTVTTSPRASERGNSREERASQRIM
jgi:hypothetical protein